MSYPRLAARLYNTPLLIEAGKAQVIEAVFRAYAEGRPESLPPFEAKPTAGAPVPMERTDNGYSLTPGGVAVLPVHGTLVQRADGLDAMSGLTGYNRIAAQFDAAMKDPKVRGVVLEFDSPGGEVAGVFELAGQIMAATKPVYAHANEMAFSAAYALAVGAEQLFVAQTGMVGSVGVIMMHVDQSQADAKKGMVYTPIFAGAKKTDFSSHAPLTDSARAAAQDQVDRLYQIFVDHVASARGVDQAVVKGTEAGLLTPGQALDIGMADGQASLGEVIQRMQDSFSSTFQAYTRPTRASSQRSSTMSTTDKTPGQSAATEEQIAAARADAAKTAAAEAKAAERARVAAITSSPEAQGREALAQHMAMNTDMTADEAIAMLKVAPKQQAAAAGGDEFSKAMAGVPNPRLTPTTGADATGDTAKAAAPVAENVFAFRRQCVANARNAA